MCFTSVIDVNGFFLVRIVACKTTLPLESPAVQILRSDTRALASVSDLFLIFQNSEEFDQQFRRSEQAFAHALSNAISLSLRVSAVAGPNSKAVKNSAMAFLA